MASRPLIQLNHVSYAYQQPGGGQVSALSDVTLSVHAGEYVAIIGSNGSGKSTLARLMNGLLLPTAGAVVIDDMDTSDKANLPRIHQLIGMVFQHPENQMVATIVEDDIAFGLENLCVPRSEMHTRVGEALELVGMTAHRRRPPHQLSGGQKQRIAIAGVWALQPLCTVFDEATSMLDAPGRDDVCALMSTLHKAGVAVLTITHHMNEAAQADRVVVLNEGRIVMQGTPRELFAQVTELQSLGLDVPLVSDIAHRLIAVGVPLSNGVITHQELAAELQSVQSVPDFMLSQPKSADVTQSAVPQREPVIVLDNVSFTYSPRTPMAYQALEGVSLTVHAGEFFAIVGQTGSGKSTLIQLLNGLQLPQTGCVQIAGIDTLEASRRRPLMRRLRSMVGLVFQQPEDQLFEPLIGDDIAYGPFQLGLSVDEARDRVRFAMDAVGFDFDWRDRPTYGLSGGEKRKVAIAGVLAMMPKILVLDEPAAGLDPHSREELLLRLKALNERGMTIVIVSHQMEDVARFAHRICVLQHGRVVAVQAPPTLFSDARRLHELGIAEPESVQLLRVVADRLMRPINPLRFERDQVYREIAESIGHGPGKAGDARV